jgi:hypothetical protein
MQACFSDGAERNQGVSPRGLVIGAFAHLIPAATVANGDLRRAMTEPLAEGRDEVLYLICTHPRIKTVGSISPERTVGVARALPGGLGGGIAWDPFVWARLRLPEHVQLSVAPWSILDPALETVEGLKPVEFDPSRDPDGWAGRHRQELLGWIFDRHLERGNGADGAAQRGEVEGGFLDFRLEYIGRSGAGALRRATGPHHKLPLILNRMLVFEPDRLVYPLPCEPRIATYDPEDEEARIPMRHLAEACEEFGLERELVTAAAEEMLIAWLGANHNKSGTQERRFPKSQSAKRLRECGFTQARIGLIGLPPQMRIQGTESSAKRDTRVRSWELD